MNPKSSDTTAPAQSPARIHIHTTDRSWIGALLKIVAMLALMAALFGANLRTSAADAAPAVSIIMDTAGTALQADRDGSIIRASLKTF